MNSILSACLALLPQNTTTILMECNVLFLKGQYRYINDPSYGPEERATGLIHYSNCEYISKELKKYLKTCTKKRRLK